jgi:hypothetical protein
MKVLITTKNEGIFLCNLISNGIENENNNGRAIKRLGFIVLTP